MWYFRHAQTWSLMAGLKPVVFRIRFGTPNLYQFWYALSMSKLRNRRRSLPPRTGAMWLWFGGIPAVETATLGQTMTIPVGTATLNFWMRIGTVSSPFTDVLNVRVDGAIVASFPEPAVAEANYTLRSINLNAYANGAAHQVLFEYIGPTTGTGSFVIDDVELASCPPPGPIPLVISEFRQWGTQSEHFN